MQIRQTSNQHFGMAVKYSPSEFAVKNHIIGKHNAGKVLKSEIILEQLMANRALTNLALVQNGKKVRLQATVGDKTYNENLLNSPYRVLKNTLKASKEESQIELIADVIKILAKDS